MTIPDILTVSRVVLTPVVVALILANQRTAAFVVYSLAATTDMLDGYLARRSGCVSKRGDFLDAAADSVLVLTVAIVLGLKLKTMWLLVPTGVLTLFFVTVVTALSLQEKALALPHLRSAKVLAFFIHAALLGYIAGWTTAWALVIVGLVPGMYAILEYIAHAMAGYKDRGGPEIVE